MLERRFKHIKTGIIASNYLGNSLMVDGLCSYKYTDGNNRVIPFEFIEGTNSWVEMFPIAYKYDGIIFKRFIETPIYRNGGVTLSAIQKQTAIPYWHESEIPKEEGVKYGEITKHPDCNGTLATHTPCSPRKFYCVKEHDSTRVGFIFIFLGSEHDPSPEYWTEVYQALPESDPEKFLDNIGQSGKIIKFINETEYIIIDAEKEEEDPKITIPHIPQSHLEDWLKLETQYLHQHIDGISERMKKHFKI